jgi:hypothetical protein
VQYKNPTKLSPPQQRTFAGEKGTAAGGVPSVGSPRLKFMPLTGFRTPNAIRGAFRQHQEKLMKQKTQLNPLLGRRQVADGENCLNISSGRKLKKVLFNRGTSNTQRWINLHEKHNTDTSVFRWPLSIASRHRNEPQDDGAFLPAQSNVLVSFSFRLLVS